MLTQLSNTLKKELQTNSDALQNEIKNNFVASMDEIMSVRKATETLNKEIQSNFQALRDEIKNNFIATSEKIIAIKTATEKSVKELDDKLSTYAQDKLSESRQNYDRLFAFTQGLDKKLARNIQKHDVLEKKVLDSLDVIKKENSNFSTLETRLNEIEKSTASSHVTHMKQYAQYTAAVATTTTFSQQSSVCSTVGISPPSSYSTFIDSFAGLLSISECPKSSDKLSITICITGYL